MHDHDILSTSFGFTRKLLAEFVSGFAAFAGKASDKASDKA